MQQYFLKLHFDPDSEQRRLKPRLRADGTVDQYDLGYVQNVVAGQALAEWEDASDAGEGGDPRFLHAEKVFPVGPGCVADSANPDKLLAESNGYVLFEDGRITVKRVLTLDRDVDFHTGNIIFVGDVIVNGAVHSGFEISGRNIRIRDAVEAGRVGAMGALVCDSGVKGGGKAVLKAGESVRAKFCEGAEMHAGRNILIDGGCMNSTIYAGDKLAVKGRLVGGEIVCGGSVYVGERLGGGVRTPTSLVLGYDVDLIATDRGLRRTISELSSKAAACRRDWAKHDEYSEGAARQLAGLEKKLGVYRAQRKKLWSTGRRAKDFSSCRVIVPGKVGSNVEISIGEAWMAAPEDASDVVFRYVHGEIVMESPAMGH